MLQGVYLSNHDFPRRCWLLLCLLMVFTYKILGRREGSETVFPINRKNGLSAIIRGYFQNNWHNRLF